MKKFGILLLGTITLLSLLGCLQVPGEEKSGDAAVLSISIGGKSRGAIPGLAPDLMKPALMQRS
jgi:hypothetical protein